MAVTSRRAAARVVNSPSPLAARRDLFPTPDLRVRSPVVRAPAADGQAGERGRDGARSDVAFGVSEALVGPGAIESERVGKS